MRTFSQALVLIIGLIGGASVACRRQSSPPNVPAQVNVTHRVPLQRFSNTAAPFTWHSGFPGPLRRVVRDEATWREAWTLLWRGQSPTPPRPPIDFTHEIVVVAALGERPTNGYSIVIDSAVTNGQRLIVWVHAAVDAPGCAGADVLTQPVDLARVPWIGGVVEFRDGPEVAGC